MLEIVDINGAIAYTLNEAVISRSRVQLMVLFQPFRRHIPLLQSPRHFPLPALTKPYYHSNSFIPIQNVPTEKTIITDKTATAHLQWPQLLDSLDATAFSETAPIYTRTAPI
jgi:hypothetical protein